VGRRGLVVKLGFRVTPVDVDMEDLNESDDMDKFILILDFFIGNKIKF
jgi:hypothetical protein